MRSSQRLKSSSLTLARSEGFSRSAWRSPHSTAADARVAVQELVAKSKSYH